MKKPCGYWNSFEKCRNEALKYTSRVEFKKKSAGAYQACLKNKWMDEISGKTGNRFNKCIYSILVSI